MTENKKSRNVTFLCATNCATPRYQFSATMTNSEHSICDCKINNFP